MDNPGSCNTDSLLGNHPNKILIMKSTTHTVQNARYLGKREEDVIPSVKERDSFQSQPKKNLKIYKRP
jgi:hypothetical protein